MKRLLALLLFASPLLAQQINPTTQITWNRLVGVGSPDSNGFVCTSNAIGTATTAIQGEMYTDQAGPHYWTCAKPAGTPAWFQVDGGAVTDFKHNGTLLDGAFLPVSGIQTYDYDETTPALDAGYIAAKGHFDTTTGKWNVQVPITSPPAIEPLITVPIAGQHVIVYASTVTTCSTDNPRTSLICNADGSGGSGISQQWGPSGFPPAGSHLVVTGFNLPSYVIPANITASYAFTLSESAGGGGAWSGTCAGTGGFITPAPSTGTWNQTQTTTLVTAPIPDYSTATCSFTYSNSGTQAYDSGYSVGKVGYIIYYTGTAPPADNSLKISYGLSLDETTNTLTTDPLFPWWLNSVPVATLGDPSRLSPRLAFVSDGSTSTDCTVGGGTNHVLCQSTPGAGWTIFSAGGGSSLSLTTTGTSGAATYSGGVLNIPQYQGLLTLTTTGTSGAATLVGTTLNIPQYTAGGGGSPGGVSGNLQYNNAGAFGGDASTNDDGSGNVSVATLSTTGGAGQGGTWDATEGTAPSATAGHDLLYADATAHCIKQSLNGGSFACLGTGGGGGGYTNLTGSGSETTVAQINTAGASGTYYATTPLSIATGGTITVPVQFSKAGLWTIASGQTVTFTYLPTETDAPSQIFAGSGTVVMPAGAHPPIEWYGAVGYTTQAAAVSGTNSSTAINACFTSLSSGGQCVGKQLYYQACGLTVATSGVGFLGVNTGGVIGNTGTPTSPTALVCTAAGTDILTVSSGTTNYLFYNRFEKFALLRSVFGTGTAAGMKVTRCGGCTLSHIKSEDSVYPFYLSGLPYYGVGAIEFNSADWGDNGLTPSGTRYGFYIDGAINPQSMQFNYNAASNSGGSGTSYGFYCNTGCTDIMGTGNQTFNTSYGQHWTNPQDVHWDEAIDDTNTVACIDISGNSGGFPGADFSGGWCYTTGTVGVQVSTSDGISIRGKRFASAGGVPNLITIASSRRFAITGNVMDGGSNTNCVSLSAATSGAVTGNTCKMTNTLTCYALASASNKNTVTGNSCIGNQFVTGISLAGSSSNTVQSNTIDIGISTGSTGISADATSNNNLYLDENSIVGPATLISNAGGAGNLLPNSGTGISGATSGQVLIAGSATTATSSIALGTTGSDIPQLSSGLLSPAVLPLSTTSAFGAIKPDGTTCTTTAGVLTCTGSTGSTSIPICADTSGSGTAQVCTTSPSFTPVAGTVIAYTTSTANTGTGLTLNVNSLGAKSVAKWQTTTTLAANDIRAGTYILMTYDGTNWEASTIGNAPSGGGIPFESHTVSGASSVVFSSCLSSSYKSYQIRLIDVSASVDNTFLIMQMSTDGGSTYDTTAANYGWGKTYQTLYGGAASGQQANQASNGGFDVAGGAGWYSSGGGKLNANYTLSNPNSSNFKFLNGIGTAAFNNAGQAFGFDLTSTWVGTGAANAFRFLSGSGTISGTFVCQPLGE